MKSLFLDLETRSTVDLLKSGARRYAADPSTQITTASWFFDGQLKTASTLKTRTNAKLDDLRNDIAQSDRIVAHNAAFDVNVLKGPNHFPFLVLPVQKISCTMARAQAISFPGGLDEVCQVLNIRGKDPRGRALVMKTCKPKKNGTWEEDPTVIKELMEYNIQDVHCLMEVDKLLPELSFEERKVFERTWRKNERGLPVDVELATAIAERRKHIEFEVSDSLRMLTGNVMTAITQRARIAPWAATKGVTIPGTQKHEVAELLDDPNLDPEVRQVLEIIQEAGGMAPTKAEAILNRHVWGYYKDATRYFGARSGRGTSEGANLFNIARPSGKYDVEKVVQQLKAGIGQHSNTALTDALRGIIVAPEGYLLLDCDQSGAELGLSLWQAGDTDRLALLEKGDDLYMHNARVALGLPKEATKTTHPKERQTYKNLTLGAGYELGWRTHMAQSQRMAADMGIKRSQITQQRSMDEIASYRKINPKMVKLWKDMKDAWEKCFYEPPGRSFHAGKISLMKDGTTIYMSLPSGRAIPHYSVYVDDEGNFGFWRAKWGAMRPQKIFGGSLVEISCQSMTRDLITSAEEHIENELTDVHLILDIYDSVVALVPEAVAEQRLNQIVQIMSAPRPWTEGLPLRAEGYVHKRMKK